MPKIEVGDVYYGVDPLSDRLIQIVILDYRPVSGRVSERWSICYRDQERFFDQEPYRNRLVETQFFKNQYVLTKDRAEAEKKLMLHRLKYA